MSVKELKFLFSPSKEVLVAVRPQTGGSAIVFRPKHNDWNCAPRDYYQIMGDSAYDGDDFIEITHAEAKNIYKDIYPDESILDKMEK